MWISDARMSQGGNSKGMGLVARTCIACLRKMAVSVAGWSEWEGNGRK